MEQVRGIKKLPDGRRYVRFEGFNQSEIKHFLGELINYMSINYLIFGSSGGDMLVRNGDYILEPTRTISASMGGYDYIVLTTELFNEFHGKESLNGNVS